MLARRPITKNPTETAWSPVASPKTCKIQPWFWLLGCPVLFCVVLGEFESFRFICRVLANENSEVSSSLKVRKANLIKGSKSCGSYLPVDSSLQALGTVNLCASPFNLYSIAYARFTVQQFFLSYCQVWCMSIDW